MNSCLAGKCRREADDSLRMSVEKKKRKPAKGPASVMALDHSGEKQDDDSFVDLGDVFDTNLDKNKDGEGGLRPGSDEEALDANAMTWAQQRAGTFQPGMGVERPKDLQRKVMEGRPA